MGILVAGSGIAESGFQQVCGIFRSCMIPATAPPVAVVDTSPCYRGLMLGYLWFIFRRFIPPRTNLRNAGDSSPGACLSGH
jgi:hypothetical protein